MMISINFIYIIQKECVDTTIDTQVMHNIEPVCVSEDYDIIVSYAKRRRDYILKHGDSWFGNVDTTQEPLVTWDAFNRFEVGTSDRHIRIAFTLSIIPLLVNDVSECSRKEET